ncbi:RagB/SusD family nutrient uptake outer membrane protein [Algoriphagus aquimarinus]|uniref:RagB/SusD family nutrient uptake outer membrane protein n=1 Tax=Algoriphagus aquimarinus TaxID=237018 RepID=UPI0030D8EA08|tara:strand:- start:1000 stop:2349 length:1350 start_codon:yes stop_codon:yes gene_type:complete
MKKIYNNVIVIILLLLHTACSDFLDAKPSLSLVIPEELNEYQAILDAEPRQMNYAPKIPLLGADEMELGAAALPRLTQEELSAYRWGGDFYAVNDYGVDWTYGYQPIYYANVVLEGIQGFKASNESERNLAATLEASARFYRAWSHFQLLQVYAPPYSPEKPDQAGIPIRSSADINLATGLSDQQSVYKFILEDLEKAYGALPEFSDLKTRPSKWAVEAFRSRIYLQMQDYTKAAEASSRALALNKELMDYKNLSSQGAYYFPRFNAEVIFHANQPSTGFTFYREQWVDSELYSMYDSLDMRKSMFFRESRVLGRLNFVSRYSGDYFDWGGLAVDEVMLDRAEASARIGNEAQALDDLNYLLEHRYADGFSLLTLTGKDLLNRVLEERRKELLFRGIRWMDLRRLNQDPEFAITLKRMVQGEEKILLPGAGGYTVPIPDRELDNNPKLN